MGVEGTLYWACCEYWYGNKKEAVKILVSLMEEFELGEKMENIQKKKGTEFGPSS